MRRFAALILMASLLAIPFANPVFGISFEDTVAAYDRGNYATAFRLLKTLAEKGDANAHSNLGLVYSKGQGVPQDYNEASKRAASVASRIVSGIGR